MYLVLLLLSVMVITASRLVDITVDPLQIQQIKLVERSTDNSGHITLYISHGTKHTPYNICPDNITLMEANVMCQQMHRGMAHSITQYPIKENTETLIFINASRCYGHESALRECIKTLHLKERKKCKNSMIFGLRCVRALPNLIPNVESLERSAYVHIEPIYQLKCAMEENCLTSEAIKKYGNLSQQQLYSITENEEQFRKLFRFSSIIKNKGDAAFLPHLSNASWQWHSCHEHYHSMEVFAFYQIFSLSTDSLDDEKGLLLTGHKASFCLEDNACVDGVKPYFKCSRNKSTTGTQGISPGCSDMYLHDIDCQWIDITTLSHGRYIFRLVINPHFLVGESNYHDNAIACELYYFSYYTGLHYCHLTHPRNFW